MRVKRGRVIERVWDMVPEHNISFDKVIEKNLRGKRKRKQTERNEGESKSVCELRWIKVAT